MDVSQLADCLDSVDAFYKNIMLLFDDLVSHIREKSYASTLQSLTGPEYGYSVGSASDSEFVRWWVFDRDGDIRFTTMLVKVHDRYLRGESSAGPYKDMCRQLGRDPRFPLLLIYGSFSPRDLTRFRQDYNVRRQWLRNAALLDLRPEHTYPSPTEIAFDRILSLQSPEGTDSFWCERADLIVGDLLSIQDSEGIAVLGSRVLTTRPAAPNPPLQPTGSAGG